MSKKVYLLLMVFAIFFLNGCNVERESKVSTAKTNTKSVVDNDNINIKAVYPINPIVAINGSIKLTAIVTDQADEYLQSSVNNPVTVEWSSIDPDIAEITNDGTVIGKKEGVARIKLQANYKNFTSKAQIVDVQVVGLTNDVAEIFLSPDRAYIDIDANRKFKLTAVDYYGAATSINPGTVTFKISDTKVVSITPDTIDSNTSKEITLKGLEKGYAFITPIYTVTDAGKSIKITGTPLIVQVKDATESSKPSDSTLDGGNHLSLAVEDSEGKKLLHITHYDKTSKSLFYSYFNGSWHTETVATGAGVDSRVVVSPFLTNKNLPIVLFLDSNYKPTLWFMQKDTSDWIDSTVIASIYDDALFDDAHPMEEIGRFMDLSAFRDETNASASKLHILFYDKTKKRINLTTSSISDNSWFNWGTKYFIDIDNELQSLSLSHNHINGNARFAYILKESNESARDGGVYYASYNKGDAGAKYEKIPNTVGVEKDVVLRLDSNNVPSIMWHTDSEVTIITRTIQSGHFIWMSKNIPIEKRPSSISAVDFVFDAYNTPRVVFSADNKVRYARRVESISGQDYWIVETPQDSSSKQGEYVSIAVDSVNRAHLIFSDANDKWFSYWAEPNFFDYRVYPNVQDIQADVVGSAGR